VQRFDEVVTDPALKLREVESFLTQASLDERFVGRFHILQASGSTAQHGIVPYSHDERFHTIAAALRS
jgi:hypothetical protein